MSGPLVWLDIETTGLNPETDLILEMALFATDGDLKPLRSTLSFTIRPESLDLTKINPTVIEMHSKSGLFAECLESTNTLEDAHALVEEWLIGLAQQVNLKTITPDSAVPVCSYSKNPDPSQQALKFVMAGSTVEFDRTFYEKNGFEMAPFHYRVVNVSTVKELVRRWYGDDATWSGPKEKPHRAQPDLMDSVGELSHYREHFFIGRSR